MIDEISDERLEIQIREALGVPAERTRIEVEKFVEERSMLPL